MKTRRILVAGGIASALVLALVSFNLIGETAPAPVAVLATERGATHAVRLPAAPEAVVRPIHDAPSVDAEAAKSAWLQRHFGPDLNSAPPAGGEAAPSAPAMNELPAPGTPERFELEAHRTAELFPDTKEFIDAMKEDIAVAQHNNSISLPVPQPAP